MSDLMTALGEVKGMLCTSMKMHGDWAADKVQVAMDHIEALEKREGGHLAELRDYARDVTALRAERDALAATVQSATRVIAERDRYKAALEEIAVGRRIPPMPIAIAQAALKKYATVESEIAKTEVDDDKTL